jgi:hypothetical protein
MIKGNGKRCELVYIAPIIDKLNYLMNADKTGTRSKLTAVAKERSLNFLSFMSVFSIFTKTF